MLKKILFIFVLTGFVSVITVFAETNVLPEEDENAYLKQDFEVRFGDKIVTVNLNEFYDEDSERLDGKRIYEKFPGAQKPVVNAKMVVEKSGINITPSQAGIRIDTDRFERELNAMYESHAVHPMVLHFVAIPPKVIESDFEAVKETVQGQLQKKIALKKDDFEFAFKGMEKGQTVNVAVTPYIELGSKKIPVSLITEDQDANALLKKSWIIEVDAKELNKLVDDKLSELFEKPSKNVRIFYDDKGKIAFDGTAEDGFVIDRAQLIDGLEIALNNANNEVIIPVNKVKAIVDVPDDLKMRGIKELVAVGYSNFKGSSPARIQNVKIGLSKYNGLIMEKGKVFSFNEHLGPVDGANGFTEELVIKGDRTKKEMGGGLCQVSSTFFRAGLYGGFPIVERKGHSYAVQYYARPGGHGLDCTIYPGVADCKILNDMPSDLLIQAYNDGLDAYFKFYGTADDRTVTLDGPAITNKLGAPPQQTVYDSSKPATYYELKEHAHEGFTASWKRVVKKSGQILQEDFVTRYQARPEVIIKGGEKPTDVASPTEEIKEFSS